jgi:hypothetical protein
MTLSIMTLSIMSLTIMALNIIKKIDTRQYDHQPKVKALLCFVSFMLSVTNEPFMMSVVMLNVVMLSVLAP